MPSSLTRGPWLDLLLAGFLCTLAGCHAPLPKLEKYEDAGDRTRAPVAWPVAEDKSARTTIDHLEGNHDQLVREQASMAGADMEELETERDKRRMQLARTTRGEVEYLGEVALVAVDRSALPGEARPEDIRRYLIEQAFDAEDEGRLGDALRLAGTAVALEWANPDRARLQAHAVTPREIARRNSRRIALARMASPSIARELGSVDGEVIGDEENFVPYVDLRPRKTAIADAAALIGRMKSEHVERPSLQELHEAGINEVIIMCSLLNSGGMQVPREFMAKLDEIRTNMVNGRTMPLLVSLDGAQHALAEEVLPDGLALRIFAEGAAGSLDERTSIVWPDEFANYMRTAGRRYRGIGASVWRRQDGSIEVKPIAGGPARKAGVRNGDEILEIDGIAVENLDLVELTDMATDPARDSIAMQVRHRDGEVETVDIDLGPVIRPHVSGWRQTGMLESGLPKWNWIADTTTRTAYLRLDGFRTGGARAIRLALKEAQAQAHQQGGRLEGIVLDLRDNGGGAVHVAEEVANLFLRKGTIFRSIGRNERLRNQRASSSHAELTGIPLVILVDERSASASELVAGLLQVQADALVLGDHTFGKGSIQSSYRAFTEDCILLVTIGWYLLPERKDDPPEQWRVVDRSRSPENWGVSPDVLIPMSVDETDAALEYRTRWFSGTGKDKLHDATVGPPPDPAVELALALIRARVLELNR